MWLCKKANKCSSRINSRYLHPLYMPHFYYSLKQIQLFLSFHVQTKSEIWLYMLIPLTMDIRKMHLNTGIKGFRRVSWLKKNYAYWLKRINYLEQLFWLEQHFSIFITNLLVCFVCPKQRQSNQYKFKTILCQNLWGLKKLVKAKNI